MTASNDERIKELRAEWMRLGYLVRDLMNAPVPRNRKSARQFRIEQIRKYHALMDAVEAKITELKKADT